MNATTLHLTFNYFPLIGMALGIALLQYGMWRSNSRAIQISFGLFVVTALLTLAVYATGEIAGKGAHLMAGPPWTNIVAHRATALPTFIAIELNGIFALAGSIRMIRGKDLPRWNTIVVLVFAIAALVLTARTTHVGRQIFVLNASLATRHHIDLAEQFGGADRKDNHTEKKLWHA